MTEEKEKIRLDVYMVQNGLIQSRERAKELIDLKQVFVNNSPAKKAGQSIASTDTVEIRGETNPFVSRGGLKLQKAIREFSLDLKNKTTMDIGASTGGFTHCMLLSGAKKVFAVDVGTGQLHESLVNNPQVVNLEKTNIRTLSPLDTGKVDFISIDVSFISLTLVLPNAKTFLKENGELVALIKPQFEAGKSNLNKKGVVKDRKVHEKVIASILEFAKSIGFNVAGLSYSPVRGPEGNIEYLAYLTLDERNYTPSISETVAQSHNTL